MPRYAAFLRGVSPMNAKMPELRKAFEAAGFTEVKTVLSSGNVVFDARNRPATGISSRTAAAAAALPRIGFNDWRAAVEPAYPQLPGHLICAGERYNTNPAGK